MHIIYQSPKKVPVVLVLLYIHTDMILIFYSYSFSLSVNTWKQSSATQNPSTGIFRRTIGSNIADGTPTTNADL